MSDNPHISINKLVEYCCARAARRTAIIEDILKPKGYLLDTGYNEIERATAAYISSMGTDDSKLRELDNVFERRQPNSEHEENRLLNAHDAIELARTMDWRAPSKTSIISVNQKQPKLEIGGVSVSVNPTNIVQQSQAGRKAKAVGIIKPYFSKTSPLTSPNERAALHGTLLHWYCETFMSHLGDAVPKLCFSIDIFAQKVFEAPRAHIARRRQIEACAQEISDRWIPIKSRLVDTGKITIFRSINT